MRSRAALIVLLSTGQRAVFPYLVQTICQKPTFVTCSSDLVRTTPPSDFDIRVNLRKRERGMRIATPISRGSHYAPAELFRPADPAGQLHDHEQCHHRSDRHCKPGEALEEERIGEQDQIEKLRAGPGSTAVAHSVRRDNILTLRKGTGPSVGPFLLVLVQRA